VLVSTLGETADLLDQLGAVGAVLQPRMFDVWKEEIMRRRAFLKLVSFAPAVGITHRQDPQMASVRPTPETLDQLDELAGRYQALYHSAAPALLLTPVGAHLETLRDLLRPDPGPRIRRKLLANRARVATLAGRLAFFDLQDPMAARAYYNLALEAAQEVSDHHLAGAALGHMAFIPAADHSFAAALDYLRGANQHLQRRPHGRLSSWLAAVESELYTNAGQHPAALLAIGKARDALATPCLSDDPPWFDYYGEARLAGFEGYANLQAGRLSEARASLTHALAHLPRMAVKQRAVFLTDLATVHHRGGDLDEACRTAGDAADQLHLAGYATGFGRLREFRATVEPWKSSRQVRTLDDQLATIA
jgi:tetratricopeptide (TPR) repeat protein